MRLISEFGNEVVNTDDKKKIEKLISQGFKVCETYVKKEAPKVEGAVKKNVKRDKTNTQRDI